jgi:hypothetical protein
MAQTSINIFIRKTFKTISILLSQIICHSSLKVNKIIPTFYKYAQKIINNGTHIKMKNLKDKNRINHLNSVMKR